MNTSTNVLLSWLLVVLVTTAWAAMYAYQGNPSRGVSTMKQSTPFAQRSQGQSIAVATHLDTLSPALIADLLYMREEEKLARDIYLAFAEQYGTNIFTNIARSEQKHMDSVSTLLASYDITDPVWDNAVWVFTDPTLQTLYDNLLVQGTTSLTDALQAGITIEIQDIADLEEALTGVDPQSDIARVYTHLKNASQWHLDAFTRVLERGTKTWPQWGRMRQGNSETPTSQTKNRQWGAGTMQWKKW